MKQCRLASTILFLAAGLATSCSFVSRSPMRGLVLQEDPLQLTIVQRTSKPIRGSDGKLSVHIDDITGGQVLVEILRDSGPALLDTVSMTPGDVVKFRVAEQEYHLTLIRLENFLIGSDFAVFEVSTQAPSAERIDAIRKAAQPPKVQKNSEGNREDSGKFGTSISDCP